MCGADAGRLAINYQSQRGRRLEAGAAPVRPEADSLCGMCTAQTRSGSRNAFSVVLSTEGRVVGMCWSGLYIPRRAYLSRGGPTYPEAGLHISRRAYLSPGRLRQAQRSRGGPVRRSVVHLVTQDGIWGSGNDDVGLIQSTKAPPKPGASFQAGISARKAK